MRLQVMTTRLHNGTATPSNILIDIIFFAGFNVAIVRNLIPSLGLDLLTLYFLAPIDYLQHLYYSTYTNTIISNHILRPLRRKLSI